MNTNAETDLIHFETNKNVNINSDILRSDLMNSNIIYYGENHENEMILKNQVELLNFYKNSNTKTAVILEMFNLKQQILLDKYISKEIDIIKLQDLYDEDIEGFDIKGHYSKIINFGFNDIMDVYAGFPPRNMAKYLVKNEYNSDNIIAFFEQIRNIFGNDNIMDHSDTLLMAEMIFNGDIDHYKYFYYLIHDELRKDDDIKMETTKVDSNIIKIYDKFGKVFIAQCFKDAIMAYKIAKVFTSNKYDKIFVIMGNGHCDYNFGVPNYVHKWINHFNKKHSSNMGYNSLLLSCKTSNQLKCNTIFPQKLADYTVPFPIYSLR